MRIRNKWIKLGRLENMSKTAPPITISNNALQWISKISGEDIIKKLDSQQSVLGLSIIATPIGNLFDITIRALHILSNSDLIIAEDTRVTQKLLNFYGIKKKLLSYHKFNEHQVTPLLITQIKEGKKVALVSDAGTPLICDPGFNIVSECIKQNLPISYIPGACSVIAGLVSSGMNAESFSFFGFVPSKRAEAKKFLTRLSEVEHSAIFFETTNRLTATICILSEIVDPTREIVVVRELTKIHETVIRSTVKEIANALPSTIRGELVIVLGGKTNTPKQITDDELIIEIRRKINGVPHNHIRDIVDELSTAHEVSKKRVYSLAIKIKSDQPKEG